MTSPTQPQIEAGAKAYVEAVENMASPEQAVPEIYAAMRALDPDTLRLSTERDELVEALTFVATQCAIYHRGLFPLETVEPQSVRQASILLARIKGAEHATGE